MGSNLPRISGKDLVKALLKAGFYIARSKGSHHLLKSEINTNVRITIPVHSKELKRGTLRSIIRQTGLSVEEFKKLIE